MPSNSLHRLSHLSGSIYAGIGEVPAEAVNLGWLVSSCTYAEVLTKAAAATYTVKCFQKDLYLQRICVISEL